MTTKRFYINGIAACTTPARTIRNLVSAVLLIGFSASTQAAVLSADELLFADLVNQYRTDNGLVPVAVTTSLTATAQAHVLDLFTHAPHLQGAGCNLHSWSANGNWTPMCYTADHAQAANMWNKPGEITNGVYPGNGYELIVGGSASPQNALNAFINSAAHNDVLLNQGIWANNPWHAMGTGIHGGYYSIWFGSAVDPLGPAGVVPVPAAVWLFGSGLLGLVAIARRRLV